MKIVNKKKFIKSLTLSIFIILFFGLFIDFCRYPESYLTTWKYQLHSRIKDGNQEAIEYYQNNYLDKGKKLWED